jgi:hypothetical protein
MVLVGPGRFGSSNINLGVNVRYADIDAAAVMVELGQEGTDHSPEVSYGTHFFQDLVESSMLYLAVVPGGDGATTADAATFNHDFFERSANSLGNVVPDAEPFEGVVKLIDTMRICPDCSLVVMADPRTQRAVCFLQPQ